MLPTRPNVLELVVAATVYYLERREDPTAKELSAALGWSEARVRRVLAACPGGVPDQLELRRETRPTYSTDYPMMQVGSTRVWTYGPSRQHIAGVLKAMVNTNDVAAYMRTAHIITPRAESGRGGG